MISLEYCQVDRAYRAYLESVNQDLDEPEWKITYIRFAPNAPEQNPVEDIWLQAKRFIREFYHLCKSFFAVKRLFELVTHHQIFYFPKILDLLQKSPVGWEK